VSTSYGRLTISSLMGFVIVVALILAVERHVPPEWERTAVFLIIVGVACVSWPIRYRRYYGKPGGYLYDPFVPEAADTPRAVTEDIEKVTDELKALGFRSVVHLRDSGTTAESFTSASYFENPLTHDVAVVLVIHHYEWSSTTLSFLTEYADGTFLSSTNSDSPGLMPEAHLRPGSLAFPEIEDAARLLRAHRARLGGEEPVPDPIGGDTEGYVRRTTNAVRGGWVGSGHYYLDEAEDFYRLTWKGAITYFLTDNRPVESLRRSLMKARAARKLRELGIE
jgi:hypothetical protein